LNGFLQNIPIVKNLIPAENNIEGEYASYTPEQLADEIDKFKTANEIDQETIKSLNEKNDLYVEEISRLKDFEDQQAVFKAEKEEFDRMIAMNDTGAYEAFYETVNPETAEILYKEAVIANQSSARVKEYIASFTAMDGGAAAEILEQMVPTDINLVVVIINALDPDTRAGILSEMTPENAAVVVKMTAPAETQ
jgi:flagellar motility protein MotE (MotC chaperone)